MVKAVNRFSFSALCLGALVRILISKALYNTDNNTLSPIFSILLSSNVPSGFQCIWTQSQPALTYSWRQPSTSDLEEALLSIGWTRFTSVYQIIGMRQSRPLKECVASAGSQAPYVKEWVPCQCRRSAELKSEQMIGVATLCSLLLFVVWCRCMMNLIHFIPFYYLYSPNRLTESMVSSDWATYISAAHHAWLRTNHNGSSATSACECVSQLIWARSFVITKKREPNYLACWTR
jgi:hypothetical protein